LRRPNLVTRVGAPRLFAQEVTMLHFMWIGGWNMWFLAIIGAVMIVSGIKFARAADPHRLALLRSLSFVTTIMSLTGFFSGMIKVLISVGEMPGTVMERIPIVWIGTGESTANLVLGGLLVSLTWILIAVGVRRMPKEAL
jgi:hypothetical protein